MARTRQFASRLYAVGVYGPFAVDGFTRADTSALTVTMSVENWPDVPILAVVTVMWGDGSGARFTVPGRPRNRDGSLRASVVLRIAVPVERDQDGVAGKADVASGTVTVDLRAPARTAMTVAAE
jgi:hypothetical protein